MLPSNEPVRGYAPGSKERETLKKELARQSATHVEIPLWIGGREVRTGQTRKVVMPHQHEKVLAEFHLAGKKEVELAIQAARQAKAEWENLSWQSRAKIFIKAADLLAGPHRDVINASTMLGQSKNVFQAEIDAACELIDFFRFNAHFYEEILARQPLSVPGVKNSLEYRPLEGFIAAITPFNFTSIAANLCAAPAMLGNTVVWKPSDTQMLSAHYTLKLLKEAGLPDGVINMVGADGPVAGEVLLEQPDLGGIHFTGSTKTFQWLYQGVAKNITRYVSYPRLVGETGGKDFIFAHPSANLDILCTALVRGAFEYQGQKCSAASRAYIPKSLWQKLEPQLRGQVEELQMGDVCDFRNFVNAVIDKRSFDRIQGILEEAKRTSGNRILAGGTADSSTGYFVRPTVIVSENPKSRTMVEEIFGPVLTVNVYDDPKVEETLKLCDETSPYALTGAIIAEDREAVEKMTKRLRHSAGNFYINDKPTGAVVGQQPFGGARASGTNDKAGSYLNLLRFLSPRTIKETLEAPKHYRYPFMGEK